MSNRLSEETLRSVYDAGHQGLLQVWSEDHLAGLLPHLDLNAVLASPDARRQVRALPPQTLYYALKEKGLSDCLEVLPLLSAEQFTRICDYDVWNEDALVPRSLFAWLALYHEIDPAQMVERFRQLDEEYQIAAFSPFIQVFTEEDFERMSDEEQDRLYSFPRESLYYRISSHDEEVHRGIEQLLGAAMGEDMGYAMSLVAHAAYTPPHEAEAQLLQFRRARLEEDGFVSYEESLANFVPLPFKPFLTRWQRQTSNDEPSAAGSVSSAQALTAQSGQAGPNFLDAVWAYGQAQRWNATEAAALRQGFLYLANSLCAASKLEADDRDGLRRLLGFVRGLVGLSLEILAEGDLEQGARILEAEYPKRLLQAAFGLFEELRLGLCGLLAQEPALEAVVRELKALYARRKFGAVLSYLDRRFLPLLGYERTEILKGFFNRFPLYPRIENDSSPALRLQFAPVSGRMELEALLSKLTGLAGAVVLARLAHAEAGEQAPEERWELERSLATALVRVSLGGRFSAQALTSNELEQFASRAEQQQPDQTLAQQWQEVAAVVAQRLAAEEALGLQGLWGELAAAGILAPSVQAGLGASLSEELLSMGERLCMAKNFGSQALAELVHTRRLPPSAGHAPMAAPDDDSEVIVPPAPPPSPSSGPGSSPYHHNSEEASS